MVIFNSLKLCDVGFNNLKNPRQKVLMLRALGVLTCQNKNIISFSSYMGFSYMDLYVTNV
jgi:hypothetical protein